MTLHRQQAFRPMPARPRVRRWRVTRRVAWRFVGALLLLALLAPPQAARAANFTVTSTADNGSPGTLRAAIAGAQASTAMSDTITVTAEGTVSLVNGELALTNPNAIAGKTVTINGPGAGALFVSGNRYGGNTGLYTRVFHFSGGLTVHLNNLAVIQGVVNTGPAGGGGILQEGGAMTLDHCVVEDSFDSAATPLAGGIANVGGALTLTHCVVTSNNGGGFMTSGGGGVYSQGGSLAMTDCTVDNNQGTGAGGGIISLQEPLSLTRCVISYNTAQYAFQTASGYGGGLYSQSGSVTLTDCTIAANGANIAGDGIYLSGGSATLQGCTLSGNSNAGGTATQDYGGGLYNAGANVALTDCTVTGNSATNGLNGQNDPGGGIFNAGTLALTNCTFYFNGGSLYNQAGGAVTVSGTLLAGDPSGTNVVNNGGTVTSGGSNIVGDPNGNGFTNGVNHDQTGVTQPGLAYPPSDNGGPTPTLALLAGSPAIDADFNALTTTDQRGAARPVGARSDIGAFEYGATATANVPDSFVVTNTNNDGIGSLRRAVNNADADPTAQVVFDPAVFGPGMPRTITLTSGPLIVRQSMAIVGPGRDLLAVSGNHASAVVGLTGSGTDSLSGLTIMDGNAGSSNAGGGISIPTGFTLSLAVTDCAITGCTASIGGGLYVGGYGGNGFTGVTLTDCVFTNNTATGGEGGGIALAPFSHLMLTDCTLAGNSAAQGGGLANDAGQAFLDGCTISGNTAATGGGVYCANILTSLSRCTISGNTATTGGGIYSDGGILLLFNDTLAANSASTGSGLDNNSGTAIVDASILAGNTGAANVTNAGTVSSSGSNLIGDTNGNGFTNGTNSDQTGVTDPGLGLLKNNGGPTQTMALLAGSPAIDAVLTGSGGTDQRGVMRPLGARNDIGAYEYGAAIALDDAYSVTENTTLTVPAPGVLGNDVADGNSLTAAVQTQPAHGALTLNGDGSFNYTPDTDFLGTDSFTYGAQPGGQGGTATVTLSVTNAAPPVTGAALAGTPGRNGFYRSAVTVTLTASQPAGTFYRVDSGPQQTYAGPFTVSGDFGHLVTFYSVNQGGVAESPNGSVTFRIDSAPPVTEITGQDDPQGRLITLTDRDDFSGPGGTFYRIDSGPERAYTGPFVVSGAYEHLVTAYSLDRAGNAETPNKSLAFTLGAPAPAADVTPPVTTASLASSSFVNGFYRSAVTVTLSATDNASGVAGTFYRVDSGPQQTYTVPFTVSGDFQHLVTFYSVDGKGNAEGPAKSVTFAIDATPPATEITHRDVPGGQEITLTDRDDFSGPGGTFYRVDSGPEKTYSGPFVVSGAFTHLVTAYSLDRAGNAEAPNVSYTFTLPPPAPRAARSSAAR